MGFPFRNLLTKVEKKEQKPEVTEFYNRLAGVLGGMVTNVALQPFSQACTVALLSTKEKLGVVDALKRVRNTEDLFNGGTARALNTGVISVLQWYVTMPLCRMFTRTVTGGRFEAPKEKTEVRFTKQSMIRRVYTNCVDSYTAAFSSMISWVLAYPVTCVKMTLEAQYINSSVQMYNGFIDCTRKIWESKGWLGFFRGFRSWSLMVPLELGWPILATGIARIIVG